MGCASPLFLNAMNFLHNILVVLQVLSAIAMIGLVLMQHGKGADMGAAFGSGSSGSLFGASGSANFLSRSTAVLATVFFASTLVLAYVGNPAGSAGSSSVLSGLAAPAPVAASAPVVTASQAPGLAAQIPGQQAPAPVLKASAPVAAASAAAVPSSQASK